MMPSCTDKSPIKNGQDNEARLCLKELLSTSIDACIRGCEVIRYVHNKRCPDTSTCFKNGQPIRNLSPSNSKIGDNSLLEGGIRYKEKDDPRSALTEADGASQRVIVECLRSVWGEALHIVGEEDDEEENGANRDAFATYNIDNPSKRPLCLSLLSNDNHGIERDGQSTQSAITNVSLSDLTLYIDPMDGTREFVEHRLQNVQCLIGIVLRGIPVGGVIGIPFGNDNHIEVIYGLHLKDLAVVGKKSVESGSLSFGKIQSMPLFAGNEKEKNIDEKKGKISKTIPVLEVYTGDSNRLHKKHSLEYLDVWTKSSSNPEENPEFSLHINIAGGCGNKILRTMTSSPNALSIIPPGTCSWDTAAPTAILFATLAKYNIKGKVTDLFGGELIYDSSGKVVKNDLGVYVSFGKVAVHYHERLCQAMKQNENVLISLLAKYWDTATGNKVKENMDILKKRFCSQSQAVDLTRNKAGYLFSCHDIQCHVEKILPNKSFGSYQLIQYTVPESEVVYAKNSFRFRLHLFWVKRPNMIVSSDKEFRTEDEVFVPPSTVFCNRIITNLDVSVEFSLD